LDGALLANKLKINIESALKHLNDIHKEMMSKFNETVFNLGLDFSGDLEFTKDPQIID
jgi:hypothetical protein